MTRQELNIVQVSIAELKPSTYNPRKWSEEQTEHLKESIKRFGLIDPLIVNNAQERQNIVIGGHFRLHVAKQLGYKEVPVVYVNIPDINKEKELNLRLNRNQGEFNLELLSQFDESLLTDVGFSSEELDSIFEMPDMPEEFNLQHELEKLDIKQVTMQKGEIYDLDGSRLMIGDSTIEADMLKLMGKEKADMCLTDPPYLLNYLKGKKKHGKATEGFGYKRDRRYLETDELPDDFTANWMANVAKVQKPDFSIIVYENWKNTRIIWGEMEKYWKIKNMLIWHLNNRTQGFAAKYKFFSKYDIALLGTSNDSKELNLEEETELLQNEYETALFAISGKPHWEAYGKGKKYCPTDVIEFKADDAKSSGQGIIFGTKPLTILQPYIKVLTKRNDLILEPFGGSGSTLIAANKMSRRCYIMEKSPVYAEVIRKRWETTFGKKAKRIQ